MFHFMSGVGTHFTRTKILCLVNIIVVFHLEEDCTLFWTSAKLVISQERIISVRLPLVVIFFSKKIVGEIGMIFPRVNDKSVLCCTVNILALNLKEDEH